jgi:toxin-antitoxin system PIN domain toxin
MISADTNIFVNAANPDMQDHQKALEFINTHWLDTSFALCELVVLEIYMAIRNPAIFRKPLPPSEAVAYCNKLRQNPYWQLVDVTPEITDQLWKIAARPNLAFRSIIDARLGLTLVYHGVTEFATVNTRHFQDCGFTRVWNPLAG